MGEVRDAPEPIASDESPVWELYSHFWESLRRLEKIIKETTETYDRQMVLLRERINMLNKRRDDSHADAVVWTRLGYDVFAAEMDLERVNEEAAVQRESWFIYLFALLDGFFGDWCGLYRDNPFRDRRLSPAASMENLEALPCFPQLPLAADELRVFTEMRARRSVFVHRRGVADGKYGEIVGSHELLGQRLEVTTQDLTVLGEIAEKIIEGLICQIEPPTAVPPKRSV